MIPLVKSYVQLTKPRLSSLAVFSGVAGFLIGRDPQEPWSSLDWPLLGWLTLGLTLVGAASNTVNQAMESHLDAQMDRTRERPIPKGLLSPWQAVIFGHLLLTAGLSLLFWHFPRPVAWLAFVTYASYIFLYTPMKTRSALNTVVGTLPGALPVYIGWLACPRKVDLGNDFGVPDSYGLAVFLLLVLWQLPHFFSIAWTYREDYRKAGYRMITLHDASGALTRLLVIIGSIAVAVVSYLPAALPMTGLSYLLGVSIANAFMLAGAFALLFSVERFMRLNFILSIIYLPFVLALLIFSMESPS